MAKVHVYIEEFSQIFEDAYEFDASYNESEPQRIAEEFAEYYHSNKGAWEYIWPITFTIANPDGRLLGKIEVDRDMQPVFTGRQK